MNKHNQVKRSVSNGLGMIVSAGTVLGALNAVCWSLSPSVAVAGFGDRDMLSGGYRSERRMLHYIKVDGEVVCAPNTGTDEKPCQAQVKDSKTGKLITLSGDASAVLDLMASGTRSVRIEGEATGSADAIDVKIVEKK